MGLKKESFFENLRKYGLNPNVAVCLLRKKKHILTVAWLYFIRIE